MARKLGNKLDGQYHLVPIKTDEDGKMYMWYSFCSAHQTHDPTCDMCKTGAWVRIEHSKSK